MCTSCGNNSCSGTCVKSLIKKFKPSSFIGGQSGIPGDEGDPGVGIVNIIDNGDGTFTIFLSDGSDYTIDIPDGGQHPDEPWVVLSQLDATVIQFTGTPGVTLNGVIGDIIIDLRYNIIAPNTIAIQSSAFIPVTIDTAAPGYSGAFIFKYRFPLLASVVGGWFNGTNKKMDNSNVIANVNLGVNPPVGSQFYTGAADLELGNAAGLNEMEFEGKPKSDELIDGNSEFLLFHNSTAQIIPHP